MIRVLASIYTYISIIYTAVAYFFKAFIIFGVNKLIRLNRYTDHYTEISYNLYYYFIALVLFTALIIIAATHVGNCYPILFGIFIILPSILLLHISTKSWGYIFSRWLYQRYDFLEDYQVTRNIICLSIILPPLFLGALLTNQIAHIFLIYVFLTARLAFLDEYEMSAHDCMHKPILKHRPEDSFLEKSVIKLTYLWFNYILGILFLYPPNFYFYHHLHNHHRENCGPKDVSSIIFYHRNSISDFCRASLKFSLSWTTGIDLIVYLLCRKQYRAARNLALGIIYFYSIIYLISLISPFFAICLLIQHAVDGFMMAITIWRWHGFADPEEPQNSFKNTTNIIFETPYIYAYHSFHHAAPAMHYVFVDDYLKKNKSALIDSNMLILANIGTMDLVSLILTDQPNIIAQYVVNFSNKSTTLEETIALLKSRLLPAKNHAATTCYFKQPLDLYLKNLFLQYNKEKLHNLDKTLFGSLGVNSIML